MIDCGEPRSSTLDSAALDDNGVVTYDDDDGVVIFDDDRVVVNYAHPRLIACHLRWCSDGEPRLFTLNSAALDDDGAAVALWARQSRFQIPIETGICLDCPRLSSGTGLKWA